MTASASVASALGKPALLKGQRHIPQQPEDPVGKLAFSCTKVKEAVHPRARETEHGTARRKEHWKGSPETSPRFRSA